MIEIQSNNSLPKRLLSLEIKSLLIELMSQFNFILRSPSIHNTCPKAQLIIIIIIKKEKEKRKKNFGIKKERG